MVKKIERSDENHVKKKKKDKRKNTALKMGTTSDSYLHIKFNLQFPMRKEGCGNLRIIIKLEYVCICIYRSICSNK